MDKKTNIAIQTTLNQIGVPHSLKGYIYLVSAIDKCISERSKLNQVVNVLYKEIADENSDTVSRVERAIRHAIEVSWNRGNTSAINKIFGYTVVAEKGRPTNSEFIALVADFISIRMDEIVDGTYQWKKGGV